MSGASFVVRRALEFEVRGLRLGAVVAVLAVSCSGGGLLTTRAPPIAGVERPITELDVLVTSVTDGDSFRGSVRGEEIEVRLLGINAPERDECFATESTNWLTETIEGKEIGLAREAELDQFDRVLARAVVDGTYVNLEAVATGHALVFGATKEGRGFVEAEDAARSAGIGIWGDDICGAIGPKASFEIVEIDYNPPGPDEVETVTIKNTGDESVDLTGFILRDESSINRFELPLLVLEPSEELAIVVADCEPIYPSRTITWCSDRPVWNNDGDTALLLDNYGRIVAFDRY